MTEQMLKIIGACYPLTELDTGEFAALKVSGMKFRIRRFTAQGLGNVSVMTASGFFGLMKMDTMIINPTETDMPLFSYDRVFAMGKDALYLELFDTLLGQTDLSPLREVQNTAKLLPDHDPGVAWYEDLVLPESTFKKSGKTHKKDFDETAAAFARAYVHAAESAAACDAAAKKEKASVYVEGLLTHGGPSTNVFKKSIGDEKTAKLFREVLFATGI